MRHLGLIFQATIKSNKKRVYQSRKSQQACAASPIYNLNNVRRCVGRSVCRSVGVYAFSYASNVYFGTAFLHEFRIANISKFIFEAYISPYTYIISPYFFFEFFYLHCLQYLLTYFGAKYTSSSVKAFTVDSIFCENCNMNMNSK